MSMYYDRVREIEVLLVKYSKSGEEQLSFLIKGDKEIERYFLEKVNSVKWFRLLKKENYFDPKNIPSNDKGDILFWNVLDYLERVSEQLSDSANQKYAKELLDIIKNTVRYSIKLKAKGKKGINNYYIWWYFVKILNNIPIDLIIINNLTSEKFEIWLEEWANPEMSGDLAISNIVEQLLGKFLKDNRTIRHAEVIVKVITRIEKEGKKYSFTRRDEAKMTWSSYWTLDGLKKNSKMIGEKCSNNVIFDIADKLNLALKYKQMDAYILISDKKDVCRLKVYRSEKDNLKEKEIGFKDGYFKCTIEQYEAEQLKGLEDIYKNLFLLHRIEPKKKIEDNILLDEVKSAKDFVVKLKPKLPASIKWDNAEDLDKKLESVYEGLYEDYSQVWFRSLEDASDVHMTGADDVLAIILRDMLLTKCESKRDDGKKVLKEFLSDKYRFPLFRRFVLLCMDKFWKDYKDFFKEFLDVVPDVLDQSDYEVEFFDILEKYNKDLDAEKLKKLIENVPEYYREKSQRHEAHWKYQWLSALKDNDSFSKWYEEEKKKAELKEDKEYKPRRSAFIGSGGPVVHKSPITKEEILKMEAVDIVKFVKGFEGATGWDSLVERKPDREGLADAFQGAVKENPQKISDEIKLFYEAGYIYVYRMLRGFLDAWKSNRDIDWEKILNFYEDYIKRPGFLEEALKAQGSDSGGGKYIWMLEALCDLIEEGSHNDERTFDEKYFPQVERLYSLMLEKPKGETQPDTQRDAVTYALNTTLGKLIRSYIIFSLHAARLNKAPEKDWGKDKYDKFFDKGIEAYIWFGMFFPNMNYLDKEWAKQKAGQLKSKGVNDFQWQSFMEAYLFGSHVYDDIYKLMREHYKMAIETKVFDTEIDRRLVEHIAIGYLRKMETLDKDSDSLFWKILDQIDIPEKKYRWEEVASFFWSVTGRSKRLDKEKEKEDLPEKFREKILDFWKWTYKERDSVKEKLGDVYTSFLARIAKLTIILPKIDKDAYDWLILSAPYIDIRHNSSLFIEYLTQFLDDDESVRYIGKIFREMLKNTTPDYKKEDIIAIVERIFQVEGGWEDAAEICNTYGRRGVHFLKETFFKNQEKIK